MTFDKFKQVIQAIGGVWATNKVHFHKYAAHYAAAYRPDHPNDSPEDSTIVCRFFTGAWSGSGPHAQNIPFVVEKD